MQVETNLNDMFSYSLTLTSIIFILLIILIALLIILNRRKKPIKNVVMSKNIVSIKSKYLNMISILYNDVANDKINNRAAYQKLSSIVRNFIFESTNIHVQNYTLSDIKQVDIPILYELVSEYYDPEFSKISKGNIIASLEKTKGVIERWN